MKTLFELWNDESGQGATEYMLVLAVIVLAILGAAYLFVEPFEQGVKKLGENIKNLLSGG